MKNGPILLIDDDQDECELIRTALVNLKIEKQLVCLSNGIEALKYLKNTDHQPFLILSDINMPGMGGLKLREAINEVEEIRRKSIPFVFLTTSASTISVNAAYEMSVQGFFEKGLSLQEITELLGEICSYWKRCRHPNN